jgi:serine/threonine protein kinase
MLSPDTVLQSRYRIVRKLSAGGMGTVYLAIDGRFDSEVAIKETHFTDDALRKQFEREARLLNKLRHPAMTRVIDHFTENDGQFLVMDYVEGDDLSDMLDKRGSAFTVQEVLLWADQLLDALSYLHKQNPPVIHRDIKPQNLKLTETGQIILLDFGLAKGFAGQMSRVTTSGSIFGYTPNYAPLEQREGTGTDPRSDLYSLAATLYKLLTNITPSDVSTRASAVIGGRSDTLKPASEVNPQVTAAVSDVLKKGMAIDAEQRYASAVEMRQALRDASQAAAQGETQWIKPQPETVRYDPTSPLDIMPPLDRGKTIEERVSTLVTPQPLTLPPHLPDSFPQPVPKFRRSPLMRVGIAAAWIFIALVIGYFIFTIVERSNRMTGNSVNSSTPSPTPVMKLEGTTWKGLREGRWDETFEFQPNEKVILRENDNVWDGKWKLEGDTVTINLPEANHILPHNIEGRIQGDEMRGYFDYLGRQEKQPFTVRIIRTNVNSATANTQIANPSPSPATKLNLEGTEWKGNRVDGSLKYEETFKFMQNGKMQEIEPNDISDGTWTTQGGKVVMNVTDIDSDDIFAPSNSNSNSTHSNSYKIEGTMQGDEMRGVFIFKNIPSQEFVVRRTK